MSDEKAVEQRPDGSRAHPNSLAASRDPEIMRAIRRGRKALRLDAQHWESWANRDFRAAFQL